MIRTDWSAAAANAIGRRVDRYREQRKMTVQELSDALAEHGIAMNRPVLSNLVNGRRNTISAPEVLTLAAVLGVPPILLLFPLGEEADIEVVPGVKVDTWRAAQWFMGEQFLTKDDQPHRWIGRDPWVVLGQYRYHDALARQVRAALGAETAALHALADGAQDPQQLQDAMTTAAARRQVAVDMLRKHRDEMRNTGDVLPPLSRNLAAAVDHADDDEVGA